MRKLYKKAVAITLAMVMMIPAMGMSAKAATETEEGLLLHYDFSDKTITNGTVQDLSGNELDGTIYGDVTAEEGIMIFPGGAANSNPGNYVDMPDIDWSKYDGITISMDLYSAQGAGHRFAYNFGRDVNPMQNYMFLNQNRPSINKARFAVKADNVGDNSNNEVVANTNIYNAWKHCVVVVENGAGTMYLDGVSVGTDTLEKTHKDLGTTQNNWIAKSPYSDEYFAGEVSDFRIYGKALSAEEVTALTSEVLEDRNDSLANSSYALSSTINSGEGTVEYLLNGQSVDKAVAGTTVQLKVTAAEGYEIGKVETNNAFAYQENTSEWTTEIVVNGDCDYQVWFDSTTNRLNMNYHEKSTLSEEKWNYLVDKRVSSSSTDLANGTTDYFVFDAGEDKRYDLSSVILYSVKDYGVRTCFTIWGGNSLGEDFTTPEESGMGQLKDSNNSEKFGSQNPGNTGGGRARYDQEIAGTDTYRYIILKCNNTSGRMTSASEVKFYGTVVDASKHTVTYVDSTDNNKTGTVDVADGKVLVLTSEREVAWTINDEVLAIGKKFRYMPTGTVEIVAKEVTDEMKASGIAIGEVSNNEFVVIYGEEVAENTEVEFILVTDNNLKATVTETVIAEYVGKTVQYVVEAGEKVIKYVVAAMK